MFGEYDNLGSRIRIAHAIVKQDEFHVVYLVVKARPRKPGLTLCRRPNKGPYQSANPPKKGPTKQKI